MFGRRKKHAGRAAAGGAASSGSHPGSSEARLRAGLSFLRVPSGPRKRRGPDLEAYIREVVRDELTRALHENGSIRFLVMQGARAEAWAIFGRLFDIPEEEWSAKRLCHFCHFSSTPVAVAYHEAEHHQMQGPLP